jgi:uncharacterized protein (DUF1786 family)
VYATQEAARTFNDDIVWVQTEMGVKIIDDNDSATMPYAVHIEMRDFDLEPLSKALALFGVKLAPDAIGVAVFDHGNAPKNYSDRQFRFDYLDRRIRSQNRLSAFAYRAKDIPPIMTRLQAVATAYDGDAPLVVMDTAPAAVLGASYDSLAAAQARAIFVNVGNFHTLAFRMGPGGIEGVFEHHTGEVNTAKLDRLISKLGDGTLRHTDVFDDQGHGALMYRSGPMPNAPVIVTGPRRSLLRESVHRPYFAVPFGDMMIAGCFGLLSAMGDVLPEGEVRTAIRDSLKGKAGRPPWEVA